ncbi:MAG TPA: hypothetical protein PKE55_04765 [Kiritimatiellia bacterium]|nr:hypothetical protein [Kiritimatiellia bacterium]
MADLIPLLSAVAAIATLVVVVLAFIKLSTLASLLNRLSEQIPGTSMTAKELAGELGASIDQSFKSYMPQPDKVSSAITGSVETAMKQLQSTQAALLDKLSTHEKETVQGLAGAKTSLDGIAGQLAQALDAGQQKMTASFDGGASKLSTALESSASAIQTALSQHADHLNQASSALAAQLEKIAGLEKDIQKLLHLQEATDASIKSFSASSEFKELLAALRQHLQASDKLLEQATKPRTIRLVEREG